MGMYERSVASQGSDRGALWLILALSATPVVFFVGAALGGPWAAVALIYVVAAMFGPSIVMGRWGITRWLWSRRHRRGTTAHP